MATNDIDPTIGPTIQALFSDVDPAITVDSAVGDEPPLVVVVVEDARPVELAEVNKVVSPAVTVDAVLVGSVM
ncbi:hypothetical protein G7054_g10981 [Neopestalotiopsis clavispora]|nr:hypothetical protein G7054_g10981 [Neopestalotiopsis clavispora]